MESFQEMENLKERKQEAMEQSFLVFSLGLHKPMKLISAFSVDNLSLMKNNEPFLISLVNLFLMDIFLFHILFLTGHLTISDQKYFLFNKYFIKS